MQYRHLLTWSELPDKNSGKTYYHNAEAEQPVWTRPPDMMSGGAPGTSGTAVTVSALTPAAVPAVTAASAPAGTPTSRNGWTEWKAPNGRPYYHNASTHTSQWVRPAEMDEAASGGAAAVAAAAGKPTTGNGMTAPQASSKHV